MNTKHILETLKQQIQILVTQVATCGNTSMSKRYFDHKLFANHGTQMRDSILEVKKNFTQLQIAAHNGRTNQVAYLAEKLVVQVAAIRQALPTQQFIWSKQFKQSERVKLYHTLTKHQDYEYRLKSMIQDREKFLKQASPLLAAQQKLQNELAMLARKLICCLQVQLRIERSIARKENNIFPYQRS